MLVGDNGAGKTTFIKLLLRLYDVEQGEILINGINVKNIPYSEYIKLLEPGISRCKFVCLYPW